MAELDDDAAAARVDVAAEDGTPVLTFSGDLDLSGAQRIRGVIEDAVVTAQGHIVFEMSGLAYMDSSGIALLLTAAQRVSTVEVRNPSPIVRRVIELTGLEQALQVPP
jgi:anti-anti-sigma factor